MKHIKTLLAAAAICAAAATIPNVQALEADASISANNAYVFRGATVNDEINVNPEAEINIYKGLSFGTWGNFNTDPSEFDQINYSVGYDLSDLVGGNFNPGIKYVEYTFPGQVEAVTADDGTVTATGANPSREIQLTGNTSVAGVGLDMLVGLGFEGGLEDGIYLEATPKYALPIASDLGLDIGLTVAAQLGDNFEENGLSHVALNTGTNLSGFDVGLSYFIETDDEVQEIDEDFVVTIGYDF